MPYVGDFRSSQIGVFTGSLIILAIALLFVRWIGATRPAQLLGVGILWGCLTLNFEILFGRFVVGATWERRASDFNGAGRRAHAVRDDRVGSLAVNCGEVAGDLSETLTCIDSRQAATTEWVRIQ